MTDRHSKTQDNPEEQWLQALKALPFVKDSDAGRKFWAVSPSGDYSLDCRTGEHYALQFLEYAKLCPDGCMLNFFILDMARNMDHDNPGIEVGFISALSTIVSNFAQSRVCMDSMYSALAERDRWIAREEDDMARERSERARKAALARWGKKQTA